MRKWRRGGEAAALCALLFLALTLRPLADAAVYRSGSTGEGVKALQSALKQKGFDPGSADGVFGSRTQKAVLAFQKAYGLVQDGIAGPLTLKALGISGGGSQQDEGTVYLLARIISAEARGEPYSGQVAVGAVVLNRVEHPSFPNTVAGVIYQPGAFSCLNDGQFDQPISDSAYRAAREALGGADPSGGAIYYFNPATATNAWIWSRPLTTIIGKHRFCL